MDFSKEADKLNSLLRLKTEPIGVKFLKVPDELPEKAKRPFQMLGKKITICQAVTMARVYKWTLGLAKEDLICVPAMIAFGLTKSQKPAETLGKLFCAASFHKDQESAEGETTEMCLLEKGEYSAVLMGPLAKMSVEPDTISIYANPAQGARLCQAWAFQDGQRIPGLFGGKVECSEYLIAAFKTDAPRVAIPGQGDRIFSMTQDDEMVFSAPGRCLTPLLEGLEEAGKKIGARYPITFYQNFQPEFPKMYGEIGDSVGAFDNE